MNRLLHILFLLIVQNMFSNLYSQATPDLTDYRDGQTYRTVKLNGDIWMAENLNYKTSGSSCYEYQTANCDKYGRLYTPEQTVNACPSGWRVPTRREWFNVISLFGPFQEQYIDRDGAFSYRVVNGNERNIESTVSSILNSKLDIKLGGEAAEDGSFREIGWLTLFWCKDHRGRYPGKYQYYVNITTHDKSKYRVFRNNVTISEEHANNLMGYIRCIKN